MAKPPTLHVADASVPSALRQSRVRPAILWQQQTPIRCLGWSKERLGPYRERIGVQLKSQDCSDYFGPKALKKRIRQSYISRRYLALDQVLVVDTVREISAFIDTVFALLTEDSIVSIDILFALSILREFP